MPISLTADNLIALVTLAALEIVLGIDNIVFISIITGKLPKEQQARGRVLGLAAAMLTRILLLFALAWVIGLTRPLFELLGHGFAGRDLILLGGGLFLLAKSTGEIHEKLEGEETAGAEVVMTHSFAGVILEIGLLDIVFSLDSVITAVGMASQLWVMVTAIVIAIGIMMWASRPISEFVQAHPTVQMLALSFLLLIGMSLVAEGLGLHIPKPYIYFAMGFSVFVEMLNLRLRPRKPVQLRRRFVNGEGPAAGSGAT
jgi:predicted tellurium resistance membrane protein TerC